MTAYVLAFGIPLLIVVVLVASVVRRGLELKLLVRDGVDATGRVVNKVAFGRPRVGSKSRYLRYAYRDPRGVEHTHRSLVSEEEWDALAEGAPIAIVHSRSRPSVSAPKALVEEARRAVKGG